MTKPVPMHKLKEGDKVPPMPLKDFIAQVRRTRELALKSKGGK